MDPTDVRERVRSIVNALGHGNAKSLGCQVVYRSGCFAGIRFAFETMHAVWLSDSDHIRCFDNDGKLIKLVRLNGGQQQTRKAVRVTNNWKWQVFSRLRCSFHQDV